MIMKQLRKHVLADVAAGNAVELISSSGRGKSDFCWSLFEHACKSYPNMTVGYTDLFLATQTPPDLIGYQFKGSAEYAGVHYARSEASIPLWMQTKFVRTPGHEIKKQVMPAWGCDLMVLILDEYGQGEADVKRASAQLFLKGELGPWALPPFSYRIACSNKGARYGVTKDFDFVINRKSTYKITDDYDSWADWADRGYSHEGIKWEIMPVTRAFAKQNPTVLFEDEPKEQGPWCTPRSLCATDRYLQVIERVNGRIDTKDPAVQEGVAAKIGVPAAGQYMGFLQFRIELPQYEEVIADPDKTPVPGKPDMQMLMAYELASRTQKPHLAEVIKYVQRMPKDLAITYVSSLIRRDATFIVEPAMAAWSNKNAPLLAMIMSLS